MGRYYIEKPLLLLLFVFMNGYAYGQIKEPALKISSQNSVSSKEYQPLWLVANRNGKFDMYSRFNTVWSFSAQTDLDKNKTFDYSYGVEIIARGADHSTLYFNQGYLSIKGALFQLDAGRKQQTLGEHFKGLSSGSLLMSSNATPIPMINVSVPDYQPVPFTYGFIKFKGNLAHGWLEDSRYVKGVYLHQKSFYLQGGFDHWPIQGYGGMVHAAQWGGESPGYGKLPSTFSDYTRIFFCKRGQQFCTQRRSDQCIGQSFRYLGFWVKRGN